MMVYNIVEDISEVKMNLDEYAFSILEHFANYPSVIAPDIQTIINIK